MKRFGLSFTLAIMASIGVLFAAATPVVDLQLYHVFSFADTDSDPEFMHLMSPRASVSFKSPNEGNVRGDLALSFSYQDSQLDIGEDPVSVAVDRAYLRVRFPNFRLTAGKTRVSWGDGVLFNAADLLFGSSDTAVDLTNQELRTSTKWLTSVTVPFGPFSFVEAVVIPPEELDFHPRDTVLGGRIYTTVGSLKVEFGGAYRADSVGSVDTGKVVSPYVSLQGNFGPDWYAASSVNVAYPASEIAEELEESWLVSGGLFHMISVGWQGTLTLRLEALVRPFGAWSAQASNDAYGILLYPEVAYIPNESWNFSLRSIVSPIDLSASITTGATWNVMQGLSFHGYATAFMGEQGDLFSWKANPGSPSLGVMVGAAWVF